MMATMSQPITEARRFRPPELLMGLGYVRSSVARGFLCRNQALMAILCDGTVTL